jgi:hypothetical protein
VFYSVNILISIDALLVLTVATKETESLQRYLRSGKTAGLSVTVLGLGQTWNGGNVRVSPGGGQKINLVKAELEKYKDDKEKVILFTDRYVNSCIHTHLLCTYIVSDVVTYISFYFHYFYLYISVTTSCSSLRLKKSLLNSKCPMPGFFLEPSPSVGLTRSWLTLTPKFIVGRDS